MEPTITIDGTKATIALDGNLTVATTPSLEAAFASLPEDVNDITLDLSELSYVASAGLRVIVAQDKKARQNGGLVRLANPNEEVMDVLDVTGLVDILEIVQHQ